MSLDKNDVLNAVRRLEGVGYATKQDHGELVSGWLWAIGDKIDPPELAAAVRTWVERAERFFPKPGQLLEIAQSNRTPGSRTSSTSDPEAPCACCGAVLQLVQPEDQREPYFDDAGEIKHTYEKPKGPGRYGVLHDWRKHREAREPIVGWYR